MPKVLILLTYHKILGRVLTSHEDFENDRECFQQLQASVSMLHEYMAFRQAPAGEVAYIGQDDCENQSKHNIAANRLILNSESSCLQGTDCDGESYEEVQRDQGRVSIVNGFDGGPKLREC